MKKSIKGKALSILASTAMALSLCTLPMGVHAEQTNQDPMIKEIYGSANGWSANAAWVGFSLSKDIDLTDADANVKIRYEYIEDGEIKTVKSTTTNNVYEKNKLWDGYLTDTNQVKYSARSDTTDTTTIPSDIIIQSNLSSGSISTLDVTSKIKSGSVTQVRTVVEVTDEDSVSEIAKSNWVTYTSDLKQSTPMGITVSNVKEYVTAHPETYFDTVATIGDRQFTSLDTALTQLHDGDTLTLLSDAEIHNYFFINKLNNITIDLNNHTITAANDFHYTYENDSHLADISDSKNITFKNGTLKTTGDNKHTLNVFNSDDVILENLILDHTEAYKGAPLVINNSDVQLKGNIEFVTGENSWNAVNIDPKGGSALLDTSEANLVFKGVESKGTIKVDNFNDNVKIVSNDDQAYEILENGKVGKAAATIGDKKYGTVQEAVIAAQNGETVTVKAGKHEEEVAIKDKAIELVGEEGAQLFNVTVINTTGKELSGLAIRNIDFYGASNAVSLDSNLSTVYIQGPYKDVVIENNQMVLDDSYANETTVAITTGHEMNGLTVQNNIIKGYTISAYHNPDWSDPTAKGSKNIVYTGNTIEDVLSGIYFGAVDGVTVTDNTFTKANGVRFQYGTKIDELSENKFISRPDDTQYGSYAVRFYDDGVDGEVDLSNNYWGTKDREVIESLIENGNIEYVLDTYYVNENMDEMNTDVNIFEFDGLTLNLKVGDTAKVNVTAKDYDGNNIPLTWSSKDEKVATVKDGVITAVGEGKTQILVDANGKVIAIDVIVTTDTPTQPTNPEDKPTNPEDKPSGSEDKPIVDVKPDPTNPTTEKPADTTKTDTTTSQPKTSDDSNIVLYASIASLALVGAGILVVNKKRKSL